MGESFELSVPCEFISCQSRHIRHSHTLVYAAVLRAQDTALLELVKKEPMVITEDEQSKRIADRIKLFESASYLVTPIITEHGIESYRNGGKAVLVPGLMYTAVEQHIQHIIEVANWLEEGIKNDA